MIAYFATANAAVHLKTCIIKPKVWFANQQPLFTMATKILGLFQTTSTKNKY